METKNNSNTNTSITNEELEKSVNFDKIPSKKDDKYASAPTILNKSIIETNDDNDMGELIHNFECVHFFKRGILTIGSIAICFEG